jgi:Dynein heavy chain, N-terminal region 1
MYMDFCCDHGKTHLTMREGVQASFEQLLGKLRCLPYNVLDVKSTGWYEDFGAFKTGTKDLEIRLVNVIQLAFATVTCLSDQPLLLEVITLDEMHHPLVIYTATIFACMFLLNWGPTL